ncbi:MAG: TetR/AcrR family transcriptional regulator [Planctomycetota bacterium]|nr:TetR/AcrR family transcriptional regulator [Planctomycetota bacterium]
MTRLPAAQRREQLLDRATELFARHGYARATTAELAKAAGVTEPIIYRHFQSKRELFIALIKRTGQQTIRLWEEHLARYTDPAERLRRLMGDNPMVSSEHGKDAYRVMLQAITETDDPEIRAAIHEHIRKLHAFMAAELERAQQARKVARRFSPEILAWLLIDVGLGFGVLSAYDVPRHGLDVSGQNVREVVTRLLVGRAAPTNEPKPRRASPNVG